MVSRKISHLVSFFLLALSICCSAANIDVRLDKTQVRLGEPVELTVEYRGESSAPHVDLSSLKSSFKVQKLGTSQSISILNGRASSRLLEEYRLIPMKEGKLTVGPIRVANLVSEPMNLEVLPPLKPVTTTPSATTHPQPVVGDRPPAWVEAKLSPVVAYPRQKISYSASLYREPDLPSLELEVPSFKGFITSEPRVTEATYEENGKTYLVHKIEMDIFPVTEGFYELDPTNVAYRGRYLSSLSKETPSLQVRPLPKDGRPADFHGAVGSFSLEAYVEEGSKDIVVTVDGESLPGWEPEISFPDIPDLKILGREVEESGPDRVKIRYSVEPPPGGAHLKSLSLSYFDPEKGKYLRAESGPIHLDPPAVSKKSSEPVSDQNQILTLEKPTFQPHSRLQPSVWFAAFALPWLAILLHWAFPKAKKYLSGDGLSKANSPEELANVIKSHSDSEKMRDALRALDQFRFGNAEFAESDKKSIVDLARKGMSKK